MGERAQAKVVMRGNGSKETQDPAIWTVHKGPARGSRGRAWVVSLVGRVRAMAVYRVEGEWAGG